MRGIPTTRLVLQRELDERLRSRLFWILTVVAMAGVVALIAIPAAVRGPAKQTVVGLVGPAAQALAPALGRTAAAAGVGIRTVPVADAATARTELRSETIGVALAVDRGGARVEVKESLDPAVGSILRATVDAAHLYATLRAVGVPPATIEAAARPVPFATAAVQPPPPHLAARRTAALAAAILLYVALGLYSTAVATGVAQEKTSRTAEVLLGAVEPRSLLTGKVVGIGLSGLVQLALVAAAGLVANATARGAEIPGTVWVLLPLVVLWFVLGFALYAFAAAVAGALVARQEEVQSVSLPLALPIVASFLLVYAAVASPNAWWITLLSFAPPFAPTLMPARVALGHAPGWEVAVAALLTVAAVWALARLAARIYAPALVRGGARLGWAEALRLGRP